MFEYFISKGMSMMVYPIISLVVFVAFFTVLSIRAFIYKKPYLNEMSNLPLDGNLENNTELLKEGK